MECYQSYIAVQLATYSYQSYISWLSANHQDFFCWCGGLSIKPSSTSLAINGAPLSLTLTQTIHPFIYVKTGQQQISKWWTPFISEKVYHSWGWQRCIWRMNELAEISTLPTWERLTSTTMSCCTRPGFSNSCSDSYIHVVHEIVVYSPVLVQVLVPATSGTSVRMRKT